MGESPNVGSPAAFVNAVVDALSHLGVTHIDMPITPWKVWQILQEKGIAVRLWPYGSRTRSKSSEPIDQVWALLSDPRKIVSCVPGAQLTETVDERTFKGAISVKVGPSLTDYKGEVQSSGATPRRTISSWRGKGRMCAAREARR